MRSGHEALVIAEVSLSSPTRHAAQRRRDRPLVPRVPARVPAASTNQRVQSASAIYLDSDRRLGGAYSESGYRHVYVCTRRRYTGGRGCPRV